MTFWNRYVILLLVFFGHSANANPARNLLNGARFGDVGQVTKAIERDKANVDSLIPYGPHYRTALHLAVLYGQAEMVRLLVGKYKASLYVGDEEGWLPLHVAAYNDKFEIAKILIDEFKVDCTLGTSDGDKTAADLAEKQRFFRLHNMLRACEKLGSRVDD